MGLVLLLVALCVLFAAAWSPGPNKRWKLTDRPRSIFNEESWTHPSDDDSPARAIQPSPSSIASNPRDLLLLESTEGLVKFRNLMGTLYGFAGVAHLLDLVVGPSQLLTSVGNTPTFYELPPLGQIYAVVWSLSGPISFLASKQADRISDAGLIFYGVVEIGGAILLKLAGYDADMAVTNAIFVQVLVGASWVYSSSKEEEK